MGIEAKVSSQQITASVSETGGIGVMVSGGFGPTGSSGVVNVSAPITNTGTSTSAVIGISASGGLTVSGGSLVVDTASAAMTNAFMAAFTFSTATLIGTPVTIAASRARIYTASSFSATTVTLPTSGNQVGDRLVIRGGSPVSATITISGAFSGTETITAQNQQVSFRYQSTGAGNQWVKDSVDKHTHAASDITSGRLTSNRLPTSPQFSGGAEFSGNVTFFGSVIAESWSIPGSGAAQFQTVAFGDASVQTTAWTGSVGWSSVTGTPSEFPPAYHLQSTDTITTVSGDYSLTNIDAFIDAVANDGYGAALANVLGGTLVGHTHLAADTTFAASDRLLGRSTGGGGAGQEITCTSFGRSLLAAAAASAARSTLELGTAATSSTGDFAAASHSHGNITNDGKIGNLADQVVITTTNGAITAYPGAPRSQALWDSANDEDVLSFYDGVVFWGGVAEYPALFRASISAAAESHTHTSAAISDFNSAVASVAPEEVVEHAATTNFPATGNSSLLYIATDTSRAYRWTGAEYVEVGPVSSYPVTHTHSAADIVPTGAAGQVLKINSGATGVEWGAATPDVSIDTTAADVLSASSGSITADDPGADRIVFWDDSAGKLTYLSAGTNITITDTTISAAGSTSASDLTSGTLGLQRLPARVRSATSLYLWSAFR